MKKLIAVLCSSACFMLAASPLALAQDKAAPAAPAAAKADAPKADAAKTEAPKKAEKAKKEPKIGRAHV